MTDPETLAAATVVVPALVAALVWVLPRTWVTRTALVGALATGGLAAALTAVALTGDRPLAGPWLVIDVPGGLLVGIIGAVGLVSVLVSPAYLGAAAGALVDPRRRERTYYSALLVFWSALLAVPLAGTLGAAWLLVEATTAASALLVGFSGRATALEAGWKYLVLTSLGLGVALLGIVLLAAGTPEGGLGALSWQVLPTYAGGARSALVVYVLLLAGLAAKIGWAPVHNWLPDAHSEAPAPVSALLSAALLPAVLLVAWRCEQGLEPVIGVGPARDVLLVFGLLSVAVSVPFMLRPMAWKRLLAYSSLEHMGVVAIGLGFATPLALAGVAVHLVAHAVAKTLGFCLVTPLLAHAPEAARSPVSGIARSSPVLGGAMGLSLGSLAGLPPSPLFVSELLIVAGGFQAGRVVTATAAAVLLALAFSCLVRALLELTLGEAPARTGPVSGSASVSASGSVSGSASGSALPGLRGVGVLVAASLVLLLALAGAASWLPASDLVDTLMKGIA